METQRALLFADIVDSTAISHALGDAESALAWQSHDQMARELPAEWDGIEIDKTDGIFAVFETAAQAVGYAIEYHRRLAERPLPFRARVGIHVGAVSLRSNNAHEAAVGAKEFEVDGLAKPVAARVMSVANGGQTLATGEALAALGPTSYRVEPLGHWRLHGVDNPVALLQIGDTTSVFLPPADSAKAYRVVRRDDLWLPVREIKHSLPADRDSFVDRGPQLSDLAPRLRAGARLVSVLGPGGSGKTRFASRFAWSWLGEFPGGTWFCDLSQARTLDGLVSAVARGLSVPLGAGDPVVQLSHAIAGRGACLVVLDNFEQVHKHALATVGVWLARAPLAKFIVTTREVLGLPGEEVLALPPLPQSDAVSLFVQRARAVSPTFEPGIAEQATLDRLVALLDGLPLAIELAAARTRVLNSAALLARMSERFRLLSSRGGRQDRQATLRATIDWSWGLLDEAERAMLAQLSVFSGGFTLGAAEAVVDLTSIVQPPWKLDVLHSLVDKSLVRVLGADRFVLLESIREYAAEQLAATAAAGQPSPQIAAEVRHGRFFAALDMTQHPQSELDNLVLACRRACLRCDQEVAIGAMTRSWDILKMRGPFRAGVELGTLVASIDGLAPRHAAAAALVAGRALLLIGNVDEAVQRFESAQGLSLAVGDRLLGCHALAGLAEHRAQLGQFHEACLIYQQALVQVRELGAPLLEWDLLSGLGGCRAYQGLFEQAQQMYDAALSAAQSAGNQRLVGGSLGDLGHCHANQGHAEVARSCYERALKIALEQGDRRWEGNVRCNLGLLHHGEGRNDAALTELEAALASARDIGHVRLESVVLCNLGIVCEAAGNQSLARARFEAAVDLAQRLKDKRSEGQFLGYLGLLDGREQRTDEARRLLERGHDLLVEVGDRASLGLLQCQRAQVAHWSGDHASAMQWLRSAELIALETHADPKSDLGSALAGARALIGGDAQAQ